MGLDMYLTGVKHPFRNFADPDKNKKMDGFDIDAVHLRLGYWRKHANLHGYIVQNFAEGEDNCESIPLGRDDLIEIIRAVEAGALLDTDGFFFGYEGYDPAAEKDEDIVILKSALKWLDDAPKDNEGLTMPEFRTIEYQASW
jgi:hypothetical protein